MLYAIALTIAPLTSTALEFQQLLGEPVVVIVCEHKLSPKCSELCGAAVIGVLRRRGCGRHFVGAWQL
jgi:hypothetical protein